MNRVHLLAPRSCCSWGEKQPDDTGGGRAWARTLGFVVVARPEVGHGDVRSTGTSTRGSTAASSAWGIASVLQKSPVCTSYQMTPQAQKNPNDYGMDLNSDDSTDDESQPRKPVPAWATGRCRQVSACPAGALLQWIAGAGGWSCPVPPTPHEVEVAGVAGSGVPLPLADRLETRLGNERAETAFTELLVPFDRNNSPRELRPARHHLALPSSGCQVLGAGFQTSSPEIPRSMISWSICPGGAKKLWEASGVCRRES